MIFAALLLFVPLAFIPVSTDVSADSLLDGLTDAEGTWYDDPDSAVMYYDDIQLVVSEPGLYWVPFLAVQVPFPPGSDQYKDFIDALREVYVCETNTYGFSSYVHFSYDVDEFRGSSQVIYMGLTLEVSDLDGQYCTLVYDVEPRNIDSDFEVYVTIWAYFDELISFTSYPTQDCISPPDVVYNDDGSYIIREVSA